MEVSNLTDKRKKIIDTVNAEFNKCQIWATAYCYHGLNCVIEVDVDGDWKHDHLAVKEIMKENGCSQLSQKEIGESYDDSYHALHYYIVNN